MTRLIRWNSSAPITCPRMSGLWKPDISRKPFHPDFSCPLPFNWISHLAYRYGLIVKNELKFSDSNFFRNRQCPMVSKHSNVAKKCASFESLNLPMQDYGGKANHIYRRTERKVWSLRNRRIHRNRARNVRPASCNHIWLKRKKKKKN